MATFTTIPDASLEPGKPIRSIDGLALRDNPIAITEGAAGAPKIQTAALIAGEQMNTTNVLAATAAASVGSVGTYALAVSTTFTNSTEGSTRAGSGLRFAAGSTRLSTGGPYGTNIFVQGPPGGTLTGTWRCMGHAVTFAAGQYDSQLGTTLFLRIS